MKNDHRIAVTKSMITDAFLDLIKDKSIGSITVKKLCESANVNRATFYTHYENIYDLAEQIRKTFVNKILEEVGSFTNDASLGDMLRIVCKYIYENAKLAEIVFGKNVDSFFAVKVVESMRNKYISLWSDCEGSEQTDLNLKYTFLAYGGLAVLREWVQKGFLQSPEEIAAFIENNVRIDSFTN